MSKHNNTQYSGIALIEALIALVVISIGIVSVVFLLSNITAGNATSKAKDEAIALANETIETFKNHIQQDDYESVFGETGENFSINPDGTANDTYEDSYTETDSITGTNATFTREWSVTNISETGAEIPNILPERKEFNVTITWKDGSGNDQSITLNHLFTWIDPKNSSVVANNGDPRGGRFTGPNGDSAEVGDGEIYTDDYNDGASDGVDVDGGRKAYRDGEDTVIVDSNDKELLRIFSHEYIQIKGTIFYEASMDADEFYIVSSDAGDCAFPLSDSGGLIDDGTEFGNWKSAHYNCIVASGWRGKVGIISPVRHNYCPSVAREYIKYSGESLNDDDTVYEAFYTEGIEGIPYDSNGLVTTADAAVSFQYQNQDFVMIDLNKDCAEERIDISAINQGTEDDPIYADIQGFYSLVVEDGSAITLSGSITTETAPALIIANAVGTGTFETQSSFCRLLNMEETLKSAYICTVPAAPDDGVPWTGNINISLYSQLPNADPVLICTASQSFSASTHIGMNDTDDSGVSPNFNITDACAVNDSATTDISVNYTVSGGFGPAVTGITATDGDCSFVNVPGGIDYYNCTVSATSGTITANMNLDGGTCSPTTASYDTDSTSTITMAISCTDP